MSFEETTEQMVGLIPVAMTAGMVMKFTDAMFPRTQAPIQRVSKKSKKKKSVYNRNFFGDFSNIGY